MNEEGYKSSYGVIDRYTGEKGCEYFAGQEASGISQGNYNKHLWQPHISPEDEVLDFGCGGGFLLKVIDARKKIGVEINPHARAYAQGQGIETFSDISQVSGYFDKVISCHVLEHIPHPRQALLELKEKLRDEQSKLLMLQPLDDWRSKSQRNYNSTDINMHLYAWTPQLLGNLLKSCGMRIVQIKVINHAWPPGYKRLWRISPFVFHKVAYLWAILIKQRQLFVIACKE